MTDSSGGIIGSGGTNGTGGSGGSCGCTCASSWQAPPGWTAGTPGPVAVMHFEDTSCMDYHGELESNIKVPAHVSIISKHEKGSGTPITTVDLLKRASTG